MGRDVRVLLFVVGIKGLRVHHVPTYEAFHLLLFNDWLVLTLDMSLQRSGIQLFAADFAGRFDFVDVESMGL